MKFVINQWNERSNDFSLCGIDISVGERHQINKGFRTTILDFHTRIANFFETSHVFGKTSQSIWSNLEGTKRARNFGSLKQLKLLEALKQKKLGFRKMYIYNFHIPLTIPGFAM